MPPPLSAGPAAYPACAGAATERGEAVRPGWRERRGPRVRRSRSPLLACRNARASRRVCSSRPSYQRCVRPSVRPAVRRLPRAAGERAKPAHLSPAGAASTFKSRSSFSFTFCQLPSRARVTWGRAPTPICYSGEGGAKLGLRPLYPGLPQAGCGRHRWSVLAWEQEPMHRAEQT